MRFEYDGDADALYVVLVDGKSERQERLSDGTVLDLDTSGAILGVEVLGPGAHWDFKLAGFSLTTSQAAFLTRVAGIFRGEIFSPDPLKAAGGGWGQQSEVAAAA